MSEDAVLDFEALLAPVETVEGDPREGSAYFSARDVYLEARRAEADEGERLQDLAIASNLAAWGRVQASAVDYLRTVAKDLEVGAWLLEAAVRLHGFAGARDGFRLMRELTERFWDVIYPRPAEGDGDALRVAPLRALAAPDRGRLIFALQCVPWTPAGAQPLVSQLALLASRDFEDFERRLASKDLESSERERRREKRLAWLEGRTTSACSSAIGAIPTDRLLALREQLREAAAASEALEETLRKSYRAPQEAQEGESDPPSLHSIRETLATIESSLNVEIETRPDQKPSEEVGGEGGGATTGLSGSEQGSVLGREEILRQLERFADYLERTEPHSPLVPGLRRLARWGRTPLDSFYKEVLDDTTRQSLSKLLGIPEDERQSN